MVCCTAWSEPNPEDTKPNLFTCGFDRVILGWSIQPRESASSVKDTDNANPGLMSSTVTPMSGTGSNPNALTTDTVSLGSTAIMGSGGATGSASTAISTGVGQSSSINSKISMSLRNNKELGGGAIKDST